jgi:phospholipase/carboxylesterase
VEAPKIVSFVSISRVRLSVPAGGTRLLTAAPARMIRLPTSRVGRRTPESGGGARGAQPLESGHPSHARETMTASLLPAVVVDTAPDPDASVIWMHGLGDSGHGWSQAVPELALPAGLAVRFVFPHAPAMPVTINQGYVMPAWYDLRAADLQRLPDLAGVRASRDRIEALVAAERARGVPSSRIALAGFSQGGAIALYAGLRHAERLAAVVGLSTYLIDGESLPAEASAANRDVPVLMAHGTHDPMIPIARAEASRDALVAMGWRVAWHAYRMEHSATQEELRAVGAFLAKALATSR